ncbi:hypothetical protein Tco_0782925 [Tanacetum coccineum]
MSHTLLTLFNTSMADLEFVNQHNIVACLEKTGGNSEFHEIVNFLTTSLIHHALTISPTIYISYIEQFYNTASSQTVNDEKQIHATVYSKAVVVTEASIRSSLLLHDADGTACLTNEAIFQNLALMGYEGELNHKYSLDFFKITALCTTEDGVLGISATIDRKVKVLVSEASIRRHLKLEDFEELSSLPNAEIFEQLTNMGVVTPLFDTILAQGQSQSFTPQTSPSRITSSPLVSPQTHQPSPLPHPIDTTHHTEESTEMPYESPLHSVHSLGRDEGSLSLNELTVLCTSLSKKVASLESKLKQTKETYSTALTKIILRVKKLEKQVRIIEEIDEATDIILVTPTKVSSQSDQSEDHLRVLSAAKVLAEAAKQGRSVGLTQTYTRRRRNVGTGSGGVSTASESDSTTGGKAKDKGKEIMQEPEPPKKLKKRVQVQMSMDEEIAKKDVRGRTSKGNDRTRTRKDEFGSGFRTAKEAGCKGRSSN